MKISRKELNKLIKESVNKKIKFDELSDRKKQIQESLDKIYEDDTEMIAQPPAEAPVEAPVEQSIEAPEGMQDAGIETEEETESIFDSKPGETVILNFEGVTLKLKRQLDDLFKVVDAEESQKVKEGDYVKIQGNDTLEKGRNYKFSIYRQTPMKYETNFLESWKIIKN